MHEHENFKTMTQVIMTSAGRLTPGSILNLLVEQKTLTPSGLAWLKVATDPWHDTAVVGLEGMPDQGIGKSVTFQVIQEFSISKQMAPVPLPPGNWSCRIGSFPILGTQRVSPGNFFGEIVTQDNTVLRAIQSVQVNFAPDGLGFLDTVDYTILPNNPQGCSLPTEYTKGIVKVCGVGLEVVNTTAALQKQGLMSACRMVQPEMEPYTSYVALPANAWSTKTLTPLRTLPINIAEMALYPGFMQNEAKDGYYAPVLLKFGKERHFPTPISPVLLTDDTTSGTFNPANPIPCYTGTITSQVVPGNTTVFQVTNDNPLYYGADSNVVMFTGLSETTTLTLRVRYILERFPSDAEGQILVIATPSAVYDPVALEIYSRAAQMMPAGVAFTDNPSGEWWMRMLGSLGKVAAPLLKMIPHPAAKVAGEVLDWANPVLDSYNKKTRKNKKNRAWEEQGGQPGARPRPRSKKVLKKNQVAKSNQGSAQGRIPPNPGPRPTKRQLAIMA